MAGNGKNCVAFSIPNTYVWFGHGRPRTGKTAHRPARCDDSNYAKHKTTISFIPYGASLRTWEELHEQSRFFSSHVDFCSLGPQRAAWVFALAIAHRVVRDDAWYCIDQLCIHCLALVRAPTAAACHARLRATGASTFWLAVIEFLFAPPIALISFVLYCAA